MIGFRFIFDFMSLDFFVGWFLNGCVLHVFQTKGVAAAVKQCDQQLEAQKAELTAQFNTEIATACETIISEQQVRTGRH